MPICRKIYVKNQNKDFIKRGSHRFMKFALHKIPFFNDGFPYTANQYIDHLQINFGRLVIQLVQLSIHTGLGCPVVSIQVKVKHPLT